MSSSFSAKIIPLEAMLEDLVLDDDNVLVSIPPSTSNKSIEDGIPKYKKENDVEVPTTLWLK